MRPNLSKIQQETLKVLGKKPLEDLDQIEKFARDKIAQLTEQIREMSNQLNELKETISEIEGKTFVLCGQYEATAETKSKKSPKCRTLLNNNGEVNEA
jgi:TolA-binding protein